MLEHKDHFHGSDLEKIEKIYGIKKEEIVSFSANVNPLGLSGKLKKSLSDHLDVITGYPDREYMELRNTIAQYVSTDYERILVGNGSTELISLFINTLKPAKAMIIGPTYSEYEREVSLGGGTCLYFPLQEEDDFELNLGSLFEALDESIDLLVICNPNNPTSSAIENVKMRQILDKCIAKDIYVLVDETYVEFCPNPDKVTSIPLTSAYKNLIVLRGISKFFASPGLRLGYAICSNPDLLKKISGIKNPWTINSLAEVAGRLMFTDREYIEATRRLVDEQREHVVEELKKIDGLKVYKPTANFVLVKISDTLAHDADGLFDECIYKKMMIRNCSSFPFLSNKYFRICFMNPDDNDRLLDAVRDYFNTPLHR